MNNLSANSPAPADHGCEVLILAPDGKLAVEIISALEEAAPGTKAVVASSLGEAQQLVVDQKPSLFVLDVDATYDLAQEFLYDLRTSHPHARAIILTATHFSAQRDQVTGLGAIHFLEKPFPRADFIMLVEALLVRSEKPEAERFQGTLSDLHIADIIQIKCISGATSMLEFTGPQGEKARVYFENGQVRHATTPGKEGRAAFNEIVEWKGGTISEVPVPRDTPRSIELDWQVLLMEAVRKIDETQEARGLSGGAASVPHKARTVLVIDDSAMLLSFVQEILEEHHFKVLTADTAKEGLTMSRDANPDLILLDFILPDMKGDEVCRELMKSTATSTIPIVYVSGFGSDLQADHGEIPNVIGSLHKPFTSDMLIEAVQKYLPVEKEAAPESQPSAAEATPVAPSVMTEAPSGDSTIEAEPQAKEPVDDEAEKRPPAAAESPSAAPVAAETPLQSALPGYAKPAESVEVPEEVWVAEKENDTAPEHSVVPNESATGAESVTPSVEKVESRPADPDVVEEPIILAEPIASSEFAPSTPADTSLATPQSETRGAALEPEPVKSASASSAPPASTPTTGSVKKPGGGAYFCGDSSFFSLHWALQTIAREKLTGVLRAFWSQDAIDLFARDGRIVMVTTRNPVLYCEESPVTLVNLEADRIEAARARQSEDGCPIFITLAQEGLILREPGLQLVQHYGQKLFSQLWTDRVRFTFEQQALPSFCQGASASEERIDQWALSTLRFVQYEKLSKKSMPDTSSVPAYTRDGIERVQELRLTVAEAQFASQFNGSRPIAQISKNLKLDIKFARLTLFRFLVLEIVECWPGQMTPKTETRSGLRGMFGR